MKPIFEWELPEDHPNFTGHDDLPEAYRVFKNEREFVGGIMIEARWNGKWEANPWNTRTLVRHLLSLINKKKKRRPDIILRENDFRKFYKAYPKKKAPGQAEKTWNKLELSKKLPDIQTLLTAIENQIKEKQDLRALKKFCPEWPHPSTWLNARSWENEIEEFVPIDKKWDDPDEDEISDVPY